MGYKAGISRGQIMLLPECVEDYVSENNPVRVIDAFVDSLDVREMGFTKAKPAATGCPAYAPQDMLKLYVYGYFNKIRSSRKLMQECGRNIELFWLMGKLQPDFRTISDFRKENTAALKEVFRAFVRLCVKMGLYRRELLAVDGSKIRAQNGDDHCYNEEILTKKLRHIDEKLNAYLSQLDESDRMEKDEELSTEQINDVIAELRERKGKYQEYLTEIKESGHTQLLTTDPDARRMHSKDGFHCCYNVQTAVDGGSHLIAEYEVTNHNTDFGLLTQVTDAAKELLEIDSVEAVADKGYDSREDIWNCLKNGTVPQVGLKYGKEERRFNIEHNPKEITEETIASTNPEDIEKCLHAGVLPKCYENTAVSIEVQELSGISCFVKNADGTVTCPTGCILGAVKTKGNNTVYASKGACRQCKNRCTSSKGFKTVSFGPDTDCVPVRMYGGKDLQRIPPDARISPYNHTLDRKDYAARKKVVVRIREEKEKLKERMCLSEHPFGTVKWYHGAHYVLCRGKEKATAELGLSFLAYNLKRAINMVGVPALIAAMRG